MAGVRTMAPALLIVLVASCGDDPNALTGGRSPRRSSGTATSADGTASDDGASSAGTSGAAASGGARPGTPSTRPSTPGGTPTSTPTSTSTSTPGGGAAAQVCVDTINQYRQTLSLPALARWTAAETCSDGEAASDGQTSRPHGAFGSCGEKAQNECPGWPGAPAQMIPGCLSAMWSEGPGGGHHDNMASAQWKQVSCGFATLPNGGVWAVQNFR